jgi:hypothetical protein
MSGGMSAPRKDFFAKYLHPGFLNGDPEVNPRASLCLRKIKNTVRTAYRFPRSMNCLTASKLPSCEWMAETKSK